MLFTLHAPKSRACIHKRLYTKKKTTKKQNGFKNLSLQNCFIQQKPQKLTIKLIYQCSFSQYP